MSYVKDGKTYSTSYTAASTTLGDIFAKANAIDTAVFDTGGMDGTSTIGIDSHVPMCVHPSAKRILVIGGGDGGTVRELLRYPTIEHIDLVEIDELVVEVCRKYLPQTAGCLGDPRIHCHFEDGLKFIRHCEDEYDLIIVDSTDPFGPGEGLFTKEFYGNCYKALREDGIMASVCCWIASF